MSPISSCFHCSARTQVCSLHDAQARQACRSPAHARLRVREPVHSLTWMWPLCGPLWPYMHSTVADLLSIRWILNKGLKRMGSST